MSSDADTIHGSVFDSARSHPDGTALKYRRGGQYVGASYTELARAVRRAAARLGTLGIGSGDVVGILSPNRPEWIIADLAVMSLGGIVVPIYHTLPRDQLGYIIVDSGMRMLLVGEAGLRTKAEAVQRESGCPDEVVSLDEAWFRLGEPAPESGTTGNATGDERAVTTVGDERAGMEPGDEPIGVGVTSSDAATIVYTSGTTGEPKGVVLTHGNIVSNARSLMLR